MHIHLPLLESFVRETPAKQDLGSRLLPLYLHNKFTILLGFLILMKREVGLSPVGTCESMVRANGYGFTVKMSGGIKVA